MLQRRRLCHPPMLPARRRGAGSIPAVSNAAQRGRRLAGPALGVCVLLAAGGAGAQSDPLANPAANRPPPYYSVDTGNCTMGPTPSCPSPCFPHAKFVYNASAKCTQLLLTAVNQAQRAEGRAAIAPPSNYTHLGPGQQLFVLVNLERLSRHVPPLVGLSTYLNRDAAAGAEGSQDPPFQAAYGPVHVWLPPGGGNYGFGSTWAGNSVNSVAAVFGWMYDDGWGGSHGATSNYTCTSPTAKGCWGHRDILLGEYTGTTCTTCIAGAAYASPSAGGFKESYAFIEVRPTATTPLVFTWASELRFLPAGWERQPA
jgi:hypothetical protein